MEVGQGPNWGCSAKENKREKNTKKRKERNKYKRKQANEGRNRQR
jgi:hypothetical protein